MKNIFAISFIALIGMSCNMSNGQQSDQKVAVQNIKVSETEAIINKDNVIVLDVRTPDEFKHGHLENAVNIDFYGDNFKDEVAKLDKSKAYVVYCHSGRRSANAGDIMTGLGYTNVYNVLGGIVAWGDAKMQIVK